MKESQSRDSESKALKKLLEQCIKQCITGKRRTVHPYADHLIDIEWAIFGGLTWADESYRWGTLKAHRNRLKSFHHFCKRVCKALNIQYRHLLFYFRSEPNDAGDWHSHFLIGAKGIEPATPAQLAEALQRTWTEQFKQGVAEIEPFDPNRQLEGVSYVCKVIRDEIGNEIDMPFAFSKALEKLVKDRHVVNPTGLNN